MEIFLKLVVHVSTVIVTAAIYTHMLLDNWHRSMTEVKEDDSLEVMNTPEQGSLWKHTNGNIYRVSYVSNVDTTRPEQYPVTVVYGNVNNGSIWSRPLSDWYRSMTEVKEDGDMG